MNLVRCSLLSAIMTLIPALTGAQVPPVVKDPSASRFVLRPKQRSFTLTSLQLKPSHTISRDTTGNGLILDLGDTTLYGRLYAGQAFFDERTSDYPETRFRSGADIVKGRATIPLKMYFDSSSHANANGWADRGVIGYRLDLLRSKNGIPVHGGLFESRVFFRKRAGGFYPIVSVTDLPMVGCIQSDRPGVVTIGFTTDRLASALVEVKGVGEFLAPEMSEYREIDVQGLKSATTYRYRAIAIAEGDTAVTPWFHFTTAPRKGEGSVVFAYAGDARAPAGGGESDYFGVNRLTGRQIAREVYRRGAAFLLFGGDMSSGYTNSPEEFGMALSAFRDSYGPLLCTVPLYSTMGNHDALVDFFDDGPKNAVVMDKWPYETLSSEALFGRAVIQPTNGPVAAAGRPPYTENVYSFQYGPVKVVVINTNYWFTTHNRIKELGGCPGGYVLPDQLEWIRDEVGKSEKDPTVKYVILMMHAPAFPGGGHVNGGMWHHGNNNDRAFQLSERETVPLGPGLIEVRNEFWKIASGAKKVAAVMASDEHNYQRFLITPKTPVGIPGKDDVNGNGILDDGVISPNPDFKIPTWFVVSGGAGAPYYTQENAPWSGSSRSFTAQSHFILFRADRSKIGMEVYSTTGQLLDSVDDLTKVKR